MDELTSFQETILHVLAERARYGLGVKDALERYYGEEINHGRLYPNLDTLVDEGYVEKRSRDDRSNEYRLTERGEEAVHDELAWRIRAYVGDDPERLARVRQMVDAVGSEDG